MRNRIIILAGVLVALVVATVAAHVTIAPAESRLGASGRYTVRVPTEGQVATSGVELDGPAGATVSSVLASSGWKFADGTSREWTPRTKPVAGQP